MRVGLFACRTQFLSRFFSVLLHLCTFSEAHGALSNRHELACLKPESRFGFLRTACTSEAGRSILVACCRDGTTAVSASGILLPPALLEELLATNKRHSTGDSLSTASARGATAIALCPLSVVSSFLTQQPSLHGDKVHRIAALPATALRNRSVPVEPASLDASEAGSTAARFALRNANRHENWTSKSIIYLFEQ